MRGIIEFAVALAALANAREATSKVFPRSCGEVCVEILCRYYGITFSRDEVVAELQLGDLGETSLHHLERCLHARGLCCTAISATLSTIDQIDYPMVLHLDARAGEPVGHFGVVLRDPVAGRLVAYDPFNSGDPTIVSPAVLAKQWSGKAIIVEPPRSVRDGLAKVLVGAFAMLLGAALGVATWRGSGAVRQAARGCVVNSRV